MQTLNYIQNNQFVQAIQSVDDGKLTITTGWSLLNEAMFRIGRLTIEKQASQARMEIDYGYQTTRTVVMQLTTDLLKAAQALLLEKVSQEALDELVAKVTEDYAGVPLPKDSPLRKKTKAEQLDDEISEKIRNSNLDEKLKLLASFHVFQVLYNDYGSRSLHIKTHQTLAITHYKKLTKLAGVKYLKTIDFQVAVEPESHDFATIIFDLIKISIHTNKVGQDKLKEAKSTRLANKSKTTQSYSRSTDTRSNWQRWFDDADMPEKVDGVWVDLETGLPYRG